ncbi:MAG: CocE/NonD family hydrolase [Acidimicrobiales bacterium]
MRWRSGCALAVAFVLAAATTGCTSEDEPSAFQELREQTEQADWTIQPGVELVTVSGADPDQRLSLYDSSGEMVATDVADATGRAHFAYVLDDPQMTVEEAVAEGASTGHALDPGSYLLRDDDADPALASEPFEVLDRDEVPEAAFYESQQLEGVELDITGQPVDGAALEDGFQYLEMRDGVQLSAMVRFPDRSLYGDGPWPTVVEYSGYGPSNPDAEEAGSRLARSFGYATVSVNMRGTGCSGGVFDTFNPAQQADGYDVVETVARQPWVLHGHVGMVGLSYSGISQLYTASTAPPSLAAVTAQSVIADSWLQAWPGGIYNSGFTRQWLAERERASGAGGTEWVQARIDGGDDTCAEAVVDHGLSLDFAAFTHALDMRPDDADARDLRQLVQGVDTAVFLTGAFQDEQTGAFFGAMLDEFERARTLRIGLWNGRHPDGYSTMNVGQLYEFLELYVAERVPQMPDLVRGVAGDLVAESFGFADGDLLPDRLYDEFGDDYEAALEAYEQEDPIRVVFGNGQGANELGEPGGTFETSFSSWPPSDAQASVFYLGGQGRLSSEENEDDGVDTFRFDPDAAGTVLSSDYETLTAVQPWDWTAFPDGTALSYETPALDEDLVVAGSGYLDLWVGADAADADVQVTVSEVRPDGIEYLVQNGWLRLGHRAVDEDRSDDLEIVHPFTEAAYAALPEDELVEAMIDIPTMAHVFRAGSRLRVTISSPGRNHLTWAFEPPAGVDGQTGYRVGWGADTPSGVVLPVVDLEVPAPPSPAPCPGLRGMACRPYVPIVNGTVE